MSDILVINQYYPPDQSATASVFRDLAHTLADAGHTVTVLCGRPSYGQVDPGPWRFLSRSDDGPVTLYRVGSSSIGRQHIWSRCLTYGTYLLGEFVAVAVARSEVVIVGTDPPLAVWPALLAAKGRPVIYSVQDLHPDLALAAGMMRPGRLVRGWDAIHASALRRCAVVVCLGDAMAERLVRKGVTSDRVAVVHNGASRPRESPVAQTVAELRERARFLVVHAGNIGSAGAWTTLAGAAGRMSDGCEMLFVGEGIHSEHLRAQGIRVVPFRPPGELASVMAAGDLQVVTMRAGTEGLLVPSKLYSVLAHGRPVLAVAPRGSDVARIVREHECGLVADPDDPEGVASAIEYASCHPEALEHMSRRAEEAASTFERAIQLRQYLNLVATLSSDILSQGGASRNTFSACHD